MKFEYFPEDIAKALCEFVEEESPETIDNIDRALYYLIAVCENPYNFEYFRDMYKLLERVTKKMEVDRHVQQEQKANRIVGKRESTLDRNHQGVGTSR